METNLSIFTFKVDDVELNKTIRTNLVNAEKALREQAQVRHRLEDFSHKNDNQNSFINCPFPGLMLAVHTAYQAHYRLKLSVSDFILLIGQGLGKHINQYAEDLRDNFVSHQGKSEIRIARDSFVKGKENDWSTVFEEFTSEIKKKIKGDFYSIVIDDTSVATPISKIASEIVLMDCMKNYFEYEVSTLCGIPEITLVGSPADWENLRTKVKKIVELNKDDCLKLDWWLKELVPVVNNICDTAIKREVAKEFWSGIYKFENPGSGSPYINGWITVFLPYLASGENDFKSEITTDKIPKQICKVPFTWKYLTKDIPMFFQGGFLGARFNKEQNSVEPEHFWVVNYARKW